LGLARGTEKVAANASSRPHCFWKAAYGTSPPKGLSASSVGQSRTFAP